jgi:hypothetical protein
MYVWKDKTMALSNNVGKRWATYDLNFSVNKKKRLIEIQPELRRINIEAY